MGLPEEEKLPVAVSGVKRSLPRYYLETGVLLALVVALGLFLVTSRYWLDDEPWFVGVWVGSADHPVGGPAEERIELRVSVDRVSGSATYRSVRRAIEDAVLSDGQLEFVTRGRERVGNEQVEVVYRYAVREAADDGMDVTVKMQGGFRDEPPLLYSLRRP